MLGQWWMEILQESIDDAGKKEKEIAITKGLYHEGVPALTVILDGRWSKGSHKHSYNAKSGVAIIIAMETKKILHIGVRQKYCSICHQAEKNKTSTPAHEYFKNWDGPSSSMEMDIILEGFQLTEKRHGLRYIKFIGDGDSSVYPSLIPHVPTWGGSIKKLEYANHVTKCYRSSLEKLV